MLYTEAILSKDTQQPALNKWPINIRDWLHIYLTSFLNGNAKSQWSSMFMLDRFTNMEDNVRSGSTKNISSPSVDGS